MNSETMKSTLLWITSVILFLALLFARALHPELLWLLVVLSVALIGVLGFLVFEYRQALKTRTAAFGLNSLITTVLVICILSVFNFLAMRYPYKWDLTKNKVHTLSDQTVKLVKGLHQPIKGVFFSKANQKEQYRPLFENYQGLSPKFEVEYVDPDRELTRAKEAGIKKYGTLILKAGTRDSKVEEPTEEKLTNALIKLLKEKSPTLCSLTGHGEKSFSASDAEGYSTASKAIANQSYEVKDINLLQDAQDSKAGRIPPFCDALAILGPTKSFFAPEIKAIQSFLAEGGRSVIALDLNIKGDTYAPELDAVLADWKIKRIKGLIVDPLAKMFVGDAAAPIVASFSKDSPVTKDFNKISCSFPFSQPLEVLPDVPAGMKVQWIGQTTPQSWAVMNLASIAKGEIAFNQGVDKQGPLSVAITADGKLKDSKATKNTRLVVFATSLFATNNFSKFGENLDFFMNSLSWVLEDESMISIRAKDEDHGKIELSPKWAQVVLLLTIIVIPALIALTGVGIWIYRRKL